MTDIEIKSTFKESILWHQKYIPGLSIMPRKVEFESNLRYVLVGLRRAGKSYMLYQHIQKLLSEGVDVRKILFINFEDERICDLPKDKLHLILEAYHEMFEDEPYVFLDEIQNIEGWEQYARRLADENRMVFITGSNSHMLSKEISSALGGRYMPKEIWPFSFQEFLQYKGINVDRNWMFSADRSAIRRLLAEYMEYGGIAEVFAVSDKRMWLSSLYNRVLLSDVLLRRDIRSEKTMSLLVRKLADCLMQPVSVKRLHDLLRQDGTKTVRSTVSVYSSYLEDAFLTFHLENYPETLAERENIKKYYFRDNGLLNLFLVGNNAKLLENVIAIDLFKRYGEKVFYYKKNIEVDFYLPEEAMGIQACFELENNQTTLQHEINALVALNNYKKLERAVIVTYDTENKIEAKGLTIEVIPLAKWLL